MPAASAKRSPPKKCPVCRVSIWDKWDNVPISPWQRYTSHIAADHPAFYKWNGRMAAMYWIAIVPFLELFILATMSSSASTSSLLAIAAFPTLMITLAIVWVFHRNGTARFRRSWLQEHELLPKHQ